MTYPYSLSYKELLMKKGRCFLHCHSQGREAKESAMMESFCQKFEQGLQKLADGLQRPRGEKNHDKILLRIGRLKEKSHGVSQHYTVDLIVDDESKNVTELTWTKTLRPGTRATHPGVIHVSIACAPMNSHGMKRHCGALIRS